MDRRSFLTLVGLAACERRPAPRPAPDAAARDVTAPDVAAPPEVEEDFPAAPPPVEPADDAALRPLGDATTRLAVALWPALRDGPGNPLWSPAAAAVSLGLVAAMERPDPAARLHAFLGLGGDRADVDRGLATLLRQWGNRFDAPGFAMLQRPFVARGARLDDGARARLRGPYAAPAALVSASANEGIRARIHQFFRARTRGAVEHLVALDGIVPEVPANVVSVARAALVVRGTRGAGRFRVGGVAAIDVETAVVRAGASVARATDASVVRVPLADPEKLLDLLVPDEGKRLDAVEPGALAALLDRNRAMTPARGAVVLPALDTVPTEATRLRNALWEAGLSEPFDPERSPLAMVGVPRAWVSELFHFARASLTASDPPGGGSLGAAAFAVDRPFTWALRDARHGALLALGRVFDPRE